MAIGNTKLHKLLNRRKLLSDAVAWYEAFDTDLKQQILDWIREDQLIKEGIDADGEVVGYYSPFTESINPSKKANTHYTFFDKGDFFRSMFIVVLRDAFVVDASSESFKEMQNQDWFTNRILGLTDENLEKLKAEIKDRYVAYVQKILFGN